MSEPQAWYRLHDGKTYKVYRTDRWGLRYTVTRPDGRVLTVTSTRWGARRAIARDARRPQTDGKWWEKPVVDEFDKGGDHA